MCPSSTPTRTSKAVEPVSDTTPSTDTLNTNISQNRSLPVLANAASAAPVTTDMCDQFFTYLASFSRSLPRHYETRFHRVIMNELFAIRSELDAIEYQHIQRRRQQPPTSTCDWP
jgi:hypothetical protein